MNSAIGFDLLCLKVVDRVKAYQADDQQSCSSEPLATLGMNNT